MARQAARWHDRMTMGGSIAGRAVLAALPLVLACTAGPHAWACECEPLPLARYYEQTTTVFVGRTLTVEGADDPEGFRSARFALVGSPYKGDPSTMRYLTGDAPANCGIDVTPGITYVVFAAADPDDPRVGYVTTCSGTRRIDLESPSDGDSFVDVPAEGVTDALAALAKANEAASVPIGGVALPHSIIGLVELPSVFDRRSESDGVGVPFEPVVVRAEPQPDATVIAEIRDETAVLTREVAYELNGAVVYEQRNGRLRVSLADGRAGWIDPPVGASFHALEELLLERSSYLTSEWDGRLWPHPGAGVPFHVDLPDDDRDDRDERAIRVLEVTRVADGLWFRIEVYRANPCDTVDGQPGSLGGGWVPAWNGDGELTVWFWARGC